MVKKLTLMAMMTLIGDNQGHQGHHGKEINLDGHDDPDRR